MATKKEQEVSVELAYVQIYWTCPKCEKDNRDELEFFHHVKQIKCDCGAVLVNRGEMRWVVEE